MMNHLGSDSQGEPMTFRWMQHMPLTAAYLCQDCNCIGNCSEQCPACASTALLCLAGVLNRGQMQELPQMNVVEAHGWFNDSRAA